MTDYWNGREYGYDQIGATDPYYDINRTRFSMDPDEIINLNTPYSLHKHKKSYEQISIDSKYQELLINLRNHENEMKKLKTQIRKLKMEKKVETAQPIESFTELFHNGKSCNSYVNSEIFIVILFICIIFIVLQIQLRETNGIIRELLFRELLQNSPRSKK